MTSSSITVIMSQLAYSLPMIMVAIVGLVMIAVHSGRLTPRARLWAMLGFGITLAVALLAPVAQGVLLGQLTSGTGGRDPSITMVMSVLGFAWAALRACGMACLLFAVFAQRPA